jgi:hypothetical protein
MKATPGASVYMPLDEFEEALDFQQRSGVPHISLLGGEPTIHPRFLEMLNRVLTRGLKVLVLSGGIMPETVLQRLEELSPEQVSVLLNVAPPGTDFSERERSQQEIVMRRLGARVVLGLNISGPEISPDFLLERISSFSLAKVVRLGLAHPIVDGKNEHLHPRYYRAVGRRTAAFVARANGAEVQVEFDCGWVPCMFPAGFLEEFQIGPEQVGLRCNPILDVLPGRQVISCYPLAAIARKPLPTHEEGHWLAERFMETLAPYRSAMLFKECSACEWRKRGECEGGCVAGSLRRAGIGIPTSLSETII